MNKRFIYKEDADKDPIIRDNLKDLEYPLIMLGGINGLIGVLNRQDERIQELEYENEQLKQQLNIDKTSITSFALYQVAKRFFGKDEFEILNKSHDGIGVYNIIIKKPKSDALMSVFLDALKRTFNFQDGTKLIISCEIELFKGLF